METVRGGFDLPIGIVYAPPRWRTPFVVAAHAGALACLAAAELPGVPRGLLAVTVLASLVLQLRRFLAEQRGARPVRLLLDDQDRWTVVDPAGRPRTARLVRASLPTPHLVLLRLETTGRIRHDFILTRRTVDADTLRRLRVRLYHPKAPRA